MHAGESGGAATFSLSARATYHRGVRLLLLASVVALAVPSVARADGDVTITLSPDGEELAGQLGISAAELAERIDTRLDEAYQVSRVDDFLRAFADATSFSSRGLGVDYASHGDGVMFGVAGNVSLAAGDLGVDEREAERPVAGVAANFAIMGGVNLERFGYPQVTVFGNGFHRGGSLDELSGSITSVGVHGQLGLFRPAGGLRSLVVQWGGLAVTGGLEVSHWAFGLERELTTDFTIDGDTGSADATLAATGRFALSTTAIVLPVEATTSVRLFYFVSLYGGVGLDLQLGTSSLDAALDGEVTAVDPGDGSTVDVGTADITIDGARGPSPGKLRGLLGVQVNLWKLRVFVQLNAMPVRAASLAAGLRVVL